jgi:antitoxin VapB
MLNIKRPETYELAKAVAERTGQSLTDAVTEALRDKLKTLEQDREKDIKKGVAEILEIARKYREAIGPDIPTREEIDADIYDEYGLPR